MILMCWLLSSLMGFLPVFTGIYSSPEHLDLIRKNSQDCGDLVVNKYLSVFADIVSFLDARARHPLKCMLILYCSSVLAFQSFKTVDAPFHRQ